MIGRKRDWSPCSELIPSNVAGWETEKHRPTKRSLELMATFLMTNDPLNGIGT